MTQLLDYLPDPDLAESRARRAFDAFMNKKDADGFEQVKPIWLRVAAALDNKSIPLKIDDRPSSCRNRLADEGKPYPKSGCQHCKTGGITGCPYEKT